MICFFACLVENGRSRLAYLVSMFAHVRGICDMLGENFSVTFSSKTKKKLDLQILTHTQIRSKKFKVQYCMRVCDSHEKEILCCFFFLSMSGKHVKNLISFTLSIHVGRVHGRFILTVCDVLILVCKLMIA